MNVLDLFSGTGSSTQPFADRGHDVFRVELDPQHDADLYADVLDVTADDLPGPFDLVWASPPCTSFSIAAIYRHYSTESGKPVPISAKARLGENLVTHTLRLIRELDPSWWVMENPRGMLRKLPLVRGIPRVTVTYCQYGDTRMKPTDLWGRFPAGWAPRPMCSNGDSCHEAAPRGTKMGGTQGLPKGPDRSRVPHELGLSLCLAAEGNPQGEGQLMLTQETA